MSHAYNSRVQEAYAVLNPILSDDTEWNSKVVWKTVEWHQSDLPPVCFLEKVAMINCKSTLTGLIYCGHVSALNNSLTHFSRFTNVSFVYIELFMR